MESVEPAAGADHQYGYIHRKDDYLKRLRRIEGQARGLQRMVEDEKYCIDILTQVSAMTKALQSVALGLLDDGHSLASAGTIMNLQDELASARADVDRLRDGPGTPEPSPS